MKTTFTSGKTQGATKQLHNKKSPEKDNIKAEKIKYGTENISKETAIIYNEIVRNEKYTQKSQLWVLVAIQKPDKPKKLIEESAAQSVDDISVITSDKNKINHIKKVVYKEL